MLPVESPFKTYTGLDGEPLNNGFVYFGLPNENPITSPVAVYWDVDGTIPAAQPLRTMNGYIIRAGTPANVFVDVAYSEVVQDSKGRQVFYAQDSASFSIASAVSTLVEQIRTINNYTSLYSSFDEAIAASAGKTLIVNSVITISANKVLPSTVAFYVQKSGFFIINPGITLTVQTDFDAGFYTIFGGAGSVIFGVASRARDIAAWHGGSLTAVFSTGRTLYQSPSAVGGPVHAFEDNATLNFSNPKAPNLNAYAAYDANTIADGPASYEHFVGFQARQTYTGSGEIWVRMDSFVSRPVHAGTGAVQQMTGMRVQRPDGTGPVSNYYGILIEDPGARAFGDNYAIYCGGGDILTQGRLVAQAAVGGSCQVIARGNGQAGSFGLSIVSQGDSTGVLNQAANANLEVWTNNVKRLRLLKTGIPTYADRATASGAGLVTGDMYQTSLGQLMIV